MEKNVFYCQLSARSSLIFIIVCEREKKKKDPKQSHLVMLNTYLQFAQLCHVPVPIFRKMDI